MSGQEEVVVPIVVVGAGGAGMLAAITAANCGFEVMLLEKSIRRGCNTEWSGGLVQAAGTRVQRAAGVVDTPQVMFEDIMNKNKWKSDAEVVAMIAQRSCDVIDLFVDEVGMAMHLDQNVLYFGHTNHRMHAMSTETGEEIVQALRAYIARHPRIELVDEAEFIDARPHPAGWQVVVRHGGEVEDTVVGRKVILATNGFGANREMLRRFCPEIAEAEYIGSENNAGEGIEVAERLGAELALMSAYQGHSHVNPHYGTRLGGSLPNLGSVMVNLEGERFENEDQGYSEFAKHILKQRDGVAVEVFDGQVHEAAMATGSFRDAVAAGAVKQADSFAELAEKFNLPVETFVAEMERYNAEVDGVDWLGRSDDRHALTPPLYGAVVTGALAHTQGGVRIDTECRALRPDGTPIDGLFVTGGTAAGISGIDDAGYMSGNGLIQAFVTGLVAGEVASRDLLVASAPHEA
jgi:fumarate reductase flavoprotein subunit